MKVLITTKVWETQEYAYGQYRNVGKPSIGMTITEFATVKEAQTAIERIASKKRPANESVDAEII